MTSKHFLASTTYSIFMQCWWFFNGKEELVQSTEEILQFKQRKGTYIHTYIRPKLLAMISVTKYIFKCIGGTPKATGLYQSINI